jgi:hypothetical protein
MDITPILKMCEAVFANNPTSHTLTILSTQDEVNKICNCTGWSYITLDDINKSYHTNHSVGYINSQIVVVDEIKSLHANVYMLIRDRNGL